ncbi:MAG: hypothetical protein HGB22_11315 [Chlorobiaceae bacterium]|nr:hypothetical protein [Chlorobiaceae bacterium]
MKFKALKYGEFFQGQISVYANKRPLSIKFLECVEKNKQEWRVELEPKNGLNPGMVIAIEKDVLCEIISRKGNFRYVRLLNPDIDLDSVLKGIHLKS